jgi:hypothetical protein
LIDKGLAFSFLQMRGHPPLNHPCQKDWQ